MKILLILLFLTIQMLHGAHLVTKTKQLQPGKKTVFHPKKGESLSITKDLNHLVPDANYDIMMQNRGHVYFQEKHQSEDMYIIFNETVSKGDEIILKVNRGYFNYTTQKFQALPKPVKKILAASARKKHRAKKRVKRGPNSVITTDEYCFDNQGEIVECTSPHALINQKREHKTKPHTLPKAVTSTRLPAPEPVQKEVHTKSEKQENIFSTFAEKLKAALSKIKKTLVEEKKEKQVKQTVRSTGTVSEKPVHAAKLSVKKQSSFAKTAQKNISRPSPSEINKYARRSDQEKEFAKSIALPVFHALPFSEKKAVFEAYNIDAKSGFRKPNLKSIKAPAEQTPLARAHLQKPELYQKPENQQPERLSPLDRLPMKYKEPKYRIQALQNQQKATLPESVVMPSKIEVPKVISTLPLRRRGIPESVPSTPMQTQRKGVATTVVGKAIQNEKVVPPPIVSAIPPGIVSSMPPKTIARTQTIQNNLPASKRQLPQEQESSVVEDHENGPSPEEEPKDKIVITKILKKDKNRSMPAEPMIRMQDRILGGGYDSQTNSGRLSVRAYANRKPISAWVEVYKGKHRVKTFYSGVKREVTLPAGTYILKATYRAGSSKQRKNLGRVRLKNGDTIHKKVYFAIGTLNIIAKRKGKPLYVKVEIYKKGSSHRYAYTFSSANTGVAHLQLGQGSYRIVIKDHGETKTFDNVYIKGERTKTLPAEF